MKEDKVISDGNSVAVLPSQTSRKRCESIDIISAILIMGMVFAHECYFVRYYACKNYLLLGGILMPWFYFKSGLFFKEQKIGECLTHNLKTLMIPYFVFQLIGALLQLIHLLPCKERIITEMTDDTIRIFLHGGNYYGAALWFLPSLFFVKILYLALRKFMPAVLIFALSCCVAILFSRWNFSTPTTLISLPWGTMFYALGELYMHTKEKEKYANPAFFVYLLILFLADSAVAEHHNAVLQGSYVLWLLKSTGFCIGISFFFEKYQFHSKILETIGKYSMAVYITHWPISLVFVYLLNHFISETPVKLLCLTIILPPLLYLICLSAKLPWVGWIYGYRKRKVC